MPHRLKLFTRHSHTRARGRQAEKAATRWLVQRGYLLLERNYRTSAGEIDAIALEGQTLCFIEIKARSSPGFGSAIGAVEKRKQRRISSVAALYLASRPWEGPCRFDVLGIDLEDGSWVFHLVQDAFEVSSPES